MGGVLETGQIVASAGPGQRVVVSPGVRHLPELLSDTVLTLVHGDMRTTINHVREVFGLPVIFTNINLIKQMKFIKMNNYDY